VGLGEDVVNEVDAFRCGQEWTVLGVLVVKYRIRASRPVKGIPIVRQHKPHGPAYVSGSARRST
jgi:hypothetical protein